MREIKFRGLTSGTGKWIYGDLIRRKGMYFINTAEAEYQVIEESVGQYTGLKDKNGKEIYEGDLFKLIINNKEYIFCVEWDNEDSMYFLVNKRKETSLDEFLDYPLFELDRFFNDEINKDNLVVIGNIYENPELLEKLK